jgi:hypothetical protein
MQIYLAYDGELYDYLEKGNHGDRIRYEPNNQEGIALYEIVLDDNGEKGLKEIYEGNVFFNDQRYTNDDLSEIVNDDREDVLPSEGDIKLIITENNSSEDEKKTKKEKKEKKRSHKDKKRSHKDKKRSHKDKKRSKDKKKTKKDKKESHKDKKNK